MASYVAPFGTATRAREAPARVELRPRNCNPRCKWRNRSGLAGFARSSLGGKGTTHPRSSTIPTDAGLGHGLGCVHGTHTTLSSLLQHRERVRVALGGPDGATLVRTLPARARYDAERRSRSTD